MRHLLLLPPACIALAACAAPAAPRLGAVTLARGASAELAPGIILTFDAVDDSRCPPGSFTLELGQSAEVAPGVTLTFEAVDDSRCPPGVQCVWAGRLMYRFSIRRAGEPATSFTLSPSEPEAAPEALGGRRIRLDTAAIPAAAAPGAAIDWRATVTLVPD